MEDRIEIIRKYVKDSTNVKLGVIEKCSANIVQAAQLIAFAFKSQRKLLLCGNGGSAADCQHMATEFMSRFNRKVARPPWPAIALTLDSSFITAHSNDFSFDEIFSRQVEGYGQKNDVLLAISTSGNSNNVFWGVKKALSLSMNVIGLTGATGGAIGKECTVCIKVPSKDTQFIQEAHVMIEHLIVQLVEYELVIKES